MFKKCLFGLGVLFLLCGCGNDKLYGGFEHFDLKDKDLSCSYVQTEDDGRTMEYYIVDITPTGYESRATGLFYKVGQDDYILLEKFDMMSASLSYGCASNVKFYKDKLYGIGGETIGNSVTFVYELDGAKSEKKELPLKYGEYSIGLMGSIDEVSDDRIELSSIIFEDEHNVIRDFSCSLETYECEKIEK